MFIQVSNPRKWKNMRNKAAELYLEHCEISTMERFYENATAKSY